MNAFVFVLFLFFGRGPAELDLASSGSSLVTHRAEPKTDSNYDKNELHSSSSGGSLWFRAFNHELLILTAVIIMPELFEYIIN